jgi:hypothetical protein
LVKIKEKKILKKMKILTLPAETEGIVLLPVGMDRATLGVVELVTLSKTTGGLASRCETTYFSVLHHRSAYPVNFWITTDAFVEWVYHNDFIKFVCSIFSHPVRVQNTEGPAATTSSFLKTLKSYQIYKA